MPGRIEVDDVAPVVSGGAYPAKAVVGELVPVCATVWREGHEAVAATLVVRYLGPGYPQLGHAQFRAGNQKPTETTRSPARVKPQLLPMVAGRTPDVFHGQFTPDRVGLWTFRVDGWGDPITTWRNAVTAKLEAGQGEEDLDNDLLVGALLLERAAAGVPRGERAPLLAAAQKLSEPGDPLTRAAPALARQVTELLDRYPLRELVSRGHSYGYGSTGRWPAAVRGTSFPALHRWPRRLGHPVHGSFATATAALDRIAAMGFDVVYPPPVHPIGTVHRKGRNNSVVSGTG